MGKLNDLQAEIATGEKKTSLKRRGVDWQFNIDDARRKLKRLYPKIKTWQRTRARIIYMEWWRNFNSRFVWWIIGTFVLFLFSRRGSVFIW